MRSIKEAQELRGKRVLVRASLNEPIDNGVLKSTFRVKKMLPLITMLRDVGACTILVGHLSGNPATHSLTPVARYFEDHMSLTFIDDVFSSSGQLAISNMQDGDVIMLENIRRYPGEKQNDPAFAKQLAELADIYVNENFSAAHREHASIVGVPKLLPSYIGLQFEQEFEHLSKALNPPHPSLVIIGGAKPETKIPLIRQFLETADYVFAGGISANELFKEKGYNIGNSLVSGEDFAVGDLLEHPKLLLPIDVRVLSKGKEEVVKKVGEIDADDRIVDVGPETLVKIASVISESAFIIWNGPLGDLDLSFISGTKHLAHLIVDSSAYSIVGGGDTVGAIESTGNSERFTFLSTAGAAMIDFLVDGTLPGIEALG